jgi:hypothetical protein
MMNIDDALIVPNGLPSVGLEEVAHERPDDCAPEVPRMEWLRDVRAAELDYDFLPGTRSVGSKGRTLVWGVT